MKSASTIAKRPIADKCPPSQRYFARFDAVKCPRIMASMLSGTEIAQRITDLVPNGITITEIARRAGVGEGTLRKMRERNSRGNVDTLVALAAELKTSVAYLIGETDDPAPIPSFPERRSARRHVVMRANAGPTLEPGIEPVVTVSLDLRDSGELIASLPAREALWLREQIDRSLNRIADHEASASSSSSATAPASR